MPKRIAALILSLFPLPDLGGQALARPYTVDDMLMTEAIGKVRFDPAGRYLIFERYGPFAAQLDYRRPHLMGQLRSKLYRVDLHSGSRAAPLFDQRPGDSYSLLSISPDGSRLSFLRASAGGLAAGVYDVARRRRHELRFPVGRAIAADARWVSNSSLVLPAAHPRNLPDFFSILGERQDQVVERWQQARAGRQPTISALGSGRFVADGTQEGALVLADGSRRDVRTLARGNFPMWFTSPDGSTVAALRTSRLVTQADQRIEQGANLGGVQRALMLYDLSAGGGAALDLCPGCDVLQNSVSWSASGRYLSFFARGAGQPWSEATFRIHDRVSGATATAPLGGLKAHVVRRELDMNVGSAWLGDTFVVRAQEPAATDSAAESAAHWFRLGGAASVNLTAAFQGVRPEVIALSRDRLIMLAAREAWAVDSAGNRTNLTEAVAEPVGLWRLPHSPVGPLNDLRPAETVVLDSRADPGSPRRLLFVDLGTGAITAVPAPSATSEVLAVSPATKQVAFFDSANNVGTLVVAEAQGRRTIAEINRHLAGVEGGRPVRIDHRGPDGSSRMSWLLLPPGHRPGQRVPAVVSVYPGNGNAAGWSRWRLDSMTPLNDHILAARGFAVLYPSLPADQRLPRDPLNGLSESVLAAVDSAVAEGYIDPDRLAVQGHSYGGYAAAAVIGQTNRFKAAVAQSAPYNLYSLYGQIDPRRRLSVEQDGLNLYNVSLLETGHSGMGGPPWRDPERYLRNSPISLVEAVRTPIMLIHGDLDYVPIAQAEEYFTALTRLNKDAVFLRYFGEDHILNSPANIRDMWRRLFGWYEQHLGRPAAAPATVSQRSE